MNQEIVQIDYSSREVIDTIKKTVAKGASDAQLAQFLEVCKATGLNPFLKEIWCIPKTNTIMASRDGYLRVANDHPQFDGMKSHTEDDKEGKPVKGICTVWRKDRTHPVQMEAKFSEYYKQTPVWNQYPSAMIIKVAEVLALKRSFAINGVITQEEIGVDAEIDKMELAQQAIKRLTAPLSPEVPSQLEQPKDAGGTPEEDELSALEVKSEARRICHKLVAKDKKLDLDAAFKLIMDNKKVQFEHIEKAHSEAQIKKLEQAITLGEKTLKVRGHQ